MVWKTTECVEGFEVVVCWVGELRVCVEGVDVVVEVAKVVLKW